MADSTTGGLPAVSEAAIGDLPSIAELYDDTLIPVEQQGQAMHMTGSQWKAYGTAAAKQYAEQAKTAKTAAEAAKTAAEEAQESIENLGVEAEGLLSGEPASVEKVVSSDGTVTLKFGLPKGEKGDQGDQGPKGDQGAKGDIGSQGPKGDQGDTGPVFTPAVTDGGDLSWSNNGGLANPTTVNIKGPQGDTGPQGPKGNQGDTGPKGDQGDTGPVFTPSVTASGDLSWTNNGGLENPDTVNIKGPVGDVGPQGPKGDTGDTGPQGPKGDTGDGFEISGRYDTTDQVPNPQAGKNYYIGTQAPYDVCTYVNGEWINNGPLQGAKGDKGDTGDTGPQGPSGANGVTFTPSVSESGDLSWTNDGGLTNPASVNIKGDKGDTGPAGPKGDTGEQGPAGPAGADGDTGPQGPTGPTGANGTTFTPSVTASGDLSWTNDGGLTNPATVNIKGPKGDTGAQGPQGDTGPQGPAGADGAQGPKGDTGDTGPTGPAGETGPQGPTGPAATINGYNTLTIQAGGNVQVEQEDSVLTIGAKPKATAVTLTASGWDSTALTQTAAVLGVSADETAQLIQPMPSAASQAAYMEAGIRCTGQGANSLTFTCDTAPTESLTVYVTITEVDYT